MASPSISEARPLNPYDKAQYNVHISERIAKSKGSSQPVFSGVKYNHKPSQATSARSTTLLPPSSSSSDSCTLKIEDKENNGNNEDIYTFKGQKSASKQCYVLLIDSTSQVATLEPLDSTYTFNLATKNGTDVSSSYTHIYPRRNPNEAGRDSPAPDSSTDDGAYGQAADNDEPDDLNPYDFRHFLQTNKEKSGRGDESEYGIPSSPDYGSNRPGSARNTPLMQAKKPTAGTSQLAKSKTASSQPEASKPRKRPEPDALMTMKKTTTTTKAKPATSAPTPTVRLDRRASTHPKSSETKPKSTERKRPSARAVAPPPSKSSKIKSADFVHSSDEESDANDAKNITSSPRPIHSSPQHHNQYDSHYDDEDDEDASDEDTLTGRNTGPIEIEIEDPSAPAQPKLNKSLASLGFDGLGRLRSPSAGPISLASAANSPDPAGRFGRGGGHDEDIDFGDFGGGDDDTEGEEEDAEGEYDDEEDGEGEEDVEMEDVDVEPMDLGPPAQGHEEKQAGGSERRVSSGATVPAASNGGAVGLGIAEEDEDDPLYAEMIKQMEEEHNSSEEESEEE